MNGIEATRRYRKATGAATGTEDERKKEGERKRIVQAVKPEQNLKAGEQPLLINIIRSDNVTDDHNDHNE